MNIYTMSEISPEALITGTRYRIQHRKGILAPRLGVFLRIYSSPNSSPAGIVSAQFDHFVNAHGPERSSSTKYTYRADEWSFHKSGETIVKERVTESGNLYNALPDNVLRKIKAHGGKHTNRRRKHRSKNTRRNNRK